MRLLPVSDLHIEFRRRDGGMAILDGLPGADVLIVAGDLGVDATITVAWLHRAAHRYDAVIYVLGNHEHYRNVDALRAALDLARLPNVHVLDRSAVTIGGLRFVGATLWYPHCDQLLLYQRMMSDWGIPGFERFIATAGEGDAQYICETIGRDDVVVTHMLPSSRCVARRFIGSPLNCFFVHDIEPTIEYAQPTLWIHGHTHDRVDVKIGRTRVYANPLGYPGENPQWTPEVIDTDGAQATGAEP